MSYFKKCPHCGQIWQSREEFLADKHIKIIGYQVNFQELELGLFLFNHFTCKTTMSLEAGQFTDLYEGPVIKLRNTGSESCPEYCLHKSELRSCPAECECAYVRDIIQTIQLRESARLKSEV